MEQREKMSGVRRTGRFEDGRSEWRWIVDEDRTKDRVEALVGGLVSIACCRWHCATVDFLTGKMLWIAKGDADLKNRSS